MPKYAILNYKGKQYKVSEGQEIILEGFVPESTKKIVFDSVLLVSDSGKIQIGTPKIDGLKIEAEVVGLEKGEKIDVKTYKAKSRYRKAKGHRSQYTRVKVKKI